MKLSFLKGLLDSLRRDKPAPKGKSASKKKGKNGKGGQPKDGKGGGQPQSRKPPPRSMPAKRTTMNLEPPPEGTLEVTIPAVETTYQAPPAVPEVQAAPELVSPEPAEAAATSEPVAGELELAVGQGDPGRIATTLASYTTGPQAILRAAGAKRDMLASYEAQLSRAIVQHDFLTLSFVGSSLVIDAAFFRDELLVLSQTLLTQAEAFGKTPVKKLAPLARELAATFQAFSEVVQKKNKALEMLETRLIKAHQARDFASLSDLTSALSRDAIMLAALDTTETVADASEQRGLTATSASEKAAMLDQQLSQLHQAIVDRRFPAIADVARLISLNSGVLADPSTVKAAQILQSGQQLAAALKSQPDTPQTASVAANLIKAAGVFNGPLMEKANQLQGQVDQLQTALKAFDQAKMFTLAVTIARSGAILTDATVQKASLLAGYASRIDVSIKRKDFPGAAAALKSAMS